MKSEKSWGQELKRTISEIFLHKRKRCRNEDGNWCAKECNRCKKGNGHEKKGYDTYDLGKKKKNGFSKGTMVSSM